jgi:hypothetical protein
MFATSALAEGFSCGPRVALDGWSNHSGITFPSIRISSTDDRRSCHRLVEILQKRLDAIATNGGENVSRHTEDYFSRFKR